MLKFRFNWRWFGAFDRWTKLGMREWDLHIGPFSIYKEPKGLVIHDKEN